MHASASVDISLGTTLQTRVLNMSQRAGGTEEVLRPALVTVDGRPYRRLSESFGRKKGQVENEAEWTPGGKGMKPKFTGDLRVLS